MEENISAPETQKSKLDSSRLFQQIFLCCSITGTLLLGFALGITLHFSISTFQTQLDDMLKTTALSLADSAMVREAYHQGYRAGRGYDLYPDFPDQETEGGFSVIRTIIIEDDPMVAQINCQYLQPLGDFQIDGIL